METTPKPGEPISVDQLYKVDGFGRAHNYKGWFMSRTMVEQVDAHLDQITEGLNGYGSVREKYEAEQDTRGPMYTSKISDVITARTNIDRAYKTVAAEQKRPHAVASRRILPPPPEPPRRRTVAERLFNKAKRTSQKIYGGFLEAAKEVVNPEQSAKTVPPEPRAKPKELEKPGILVVWWRKHKATQEEQKAKERHKANPVLLIGGAAVLATAVTGALLTMEDTDKSNEGPSARPSVSAQETPSQGPETDGEDTPSQPPEAADMSHTLKYGESIWSQSEGLARSVGGVAAADNIYIVDAIKDRTVLINDFADPDELAVGTEVKVPSKKFVKSTISQYS